MTELKYRTGEDFENLLAPGGGQGECKALKVNRDDGKVSTEVLKVLRTFSKR